MKNLVTGATGLVGMHILLDLLSKGEKVKATFTKNSRLDIDHQHADLLAEGLRNCTWIDKVVDVETNIVIGYMKEGFQNSNFVEKLQKLGVSIVSFGKGRIRMVTHLDVTKEDIDKVISLLKF